MDLYKRKTCKSKKIIRPTLAGFLSEHQKKKKLLKQRQTPGFLMKTKDLKRGEKNRRKRQLKKILDLKEGNKITNRTVKMCRNCLPLEVTHVNINLCYRMSIKQIAGNVYGTAGTG